MGPRIYPSYQNENLINFFTGATPTPTPTPAGPTPTPTPTPFSVTTSVVTSNLWLYVDGSRQSNLFRQDQSLNAFTGTTGPNPASLNRQFFLDYGLYCQFTSTTSPFNPPELSFPLSSLGSNTDSWSYGGWFKMTQSTLTRFLFRGWNGSGGNVSIQLRRNSSGTIETQVRLTTGIFTAVTTSTVNVNEWFYVSCVYDRGSSIKIYINSVLSATTNLTASDNTLFDISGQPNQKGWSLAYYDDSPYTAYLYAFNEIEIYNKALTAAEVLQNYNARKIIYMI